MLYNDLDMIAAPDRTAQSTLARRHLPAARNSFFVALIALAAPPLAARSVAQTVTVPREGLPFLADVGGVRLGRLAQGSRLSSGPSRAGHTQVTIEGWVFRASVGQTNRAGHNLVVTTPTGENLRASPNGPLLARLVRGCLLDQVERQGLWVKVRRTGWVATSGLSGVTAERTPPAARGDTARPPVAPQAQSMDPRRAVARRRIPLYRAPDSTAIGSLEAGVPVRITARAGQWARVEAQGWVRENEIRMSDAAILTGVSAAELRGAPEEFRGKLLRWTIQYLALQTADELRPDFAPGQRYILARGPAPEYAFVYIIVPADKLAEVQRLEPLASLSVVVRVVRGRSAYLANPILELVDLQ